ncbi:MAG: VOC family protein [Rhodobacteraceae bacterium]|nr:VOC family protein [Paracoccaceae bacterium]
MATSSAPLEIGRVVLTVHDLASVGVFYESVLGLSRLVSEPDRAVYGSGGRALIELRADPAARRSTRREAGLFHTAFLLPSRADLGAWLRHVADRQTPLQGASDHLVSEAIYLADPEGNGIEVYRDRPRRDWPRQGDQIAMATERLDLADLANAAQCAWTGAPDGTVVGHVHLQVGSLAPAETFYAGTLGFPVTSRYPGANFYASGGYHHHLATNIWNSRNARQRDFPATGLQAVEILGEKARLDAIRARAGADPVDPWGTAFTLTEKEVAHAG